MNDGNTKEVIGYMVTWTTYGTWLQGDKRGYVKDGEVLKGNVLLEQANIRNQKGKTVRLSRLQRNIVKEAILKKAKTTGVTIISIAVCSNHLHLVAYDKGKAISKIVKQFKMAAYYAMRESGFAGRVWTKGFDKRYCFDEEELGARAEYVCKHGNNKEQGYKN